jgi:hypothetical protein
MEKLFKNLSINDNNEPPIIKDTSKKSFTEKYSRQQRINMLYKIISWKQMDNDNKKCKIKKGAGCSVSGKKYELEVYNIVKKCKLNNNIFNTQKEYELGGCNSKNDIECVMGSIIIPIEIKKIKTPDWMQCSLKYDDISKKWIGSSKNKIPENSKKIFEDLIAKITLFNNKIPPFMLKDITHEEWVQIKKETTDFNDVYIDCPNDTIKKLYSEKGCFYIQISKRGLYYLKNDICEFNVPKFICNQQLRVRTKIHTRKNAKGFCKLSVTIACQPKNIKQLPESNYSLDNINKLPDNLLYIS